MIPELENSLEKIDGFETDFVKMIYYDIPPNYIGQYKSHSYPRLCAILEGEKKISVNEKRYVYDKSKSLILPSHSKVIMEIEKPTKALVFELNNNLIDQVISHSKIQLDINSYSSAKELIINNQQYNIADDIKNLIEFGIEKKYREKFLIDIYAQKLVYNLLKAESTSKCLIHGKNQPINHAIEIMNDSLKEKINLGDIAKILNMSESSFSQNFKKYMGLSPQKYLNKLKLNTALSLLNTMSVTDVAFELGYENPSHFIKLFKYEYKITPKQYQLRGLPIKLQ